MVQVPCLLGLIPMLVRLRHIARHKSIDLIHYNECLDFVVGLVARSCRFPVVCHVRADGWPIWVQYILRGALRLFADIIIVPSNSTAEWIRNRSKELASRIRVIPDHAFDIGPYDPTLPGGTFREELRISEEAPLVIMVAKLQPDKGHLQFIRMAEIVHEHSKSTRFVIVGGPVEGHPREAQEIVRLGASAVKQGYLHMVGTRQDLPSVFSACDVFVHCPTYPDPYPTVVLLAMLMGKPAVCSRTGGMLEQIDDGITGILIPPDSPGSMASAVLDLIASPNRRRELGQAAIRKARDLYDPSGQARSIRREYEALVR
jgi:glycosyltransferase involved in cell wall biosynthesis